MPRVPVVQLSSVLNICPSNMALPLSLPVRCVLARAGPDPLSLGSPAVLSRLAEAVSSMTLSAPSERHAQTLTEQEGKATHRISMKDGCLVPSVHPGGCHLCMLLYPPAKEQAGPSSAMTFLPELSRMYTLTSAVIGSTFIH
ncbi:hypothetical protein WMY93_006912 [Mugilogobius chulae]|uniref:Uncharacterized protein n=1 Tax=Mugilogobius chulae TaxID=88201 RepID=A0AAW0PLN0_9GOBI